VIGLVDDDGRAVATSPAFEAKPAPDPAAISFLSTVVFFGDKKTMNARVLVDDVATVPTGATHVRVMNALTDHQPVVVVQCPTETGGSTPYTASGCAQVGDPVAYGDAFEMDATADVLDKLGFSWDPSSALDPVVNAFTYGANAGSTSRFVTRIPVQVAGPATPCPSCLVTVY
jgi:hypothetical protein